MPHATPQASERPNLRLYSLAVASFAVCVAVFLLCLTQGDPGECAVTAYPVVAAALPVWLRRRRWPRIVATVLILPMVEFIFSVGLFYAVAVLLMLASSCGWPSRRTPLAQSAKPE